MTTHERYDRQKKQPEYLKKYVCGLAGASYYSVLLESNNFAIIRSDGHSWYRGNYGNRMGYAPLTCYLIKKNNRGYWQDRGKEIHSGRLTKAALKKCEDILNEAENLTI